MTNIYAGAHDSALISALSSFAENLAPVIAMADADLDVSVTDLDLIREAANRISDGWKARVQAEAADNAADIASAAFPTAAEAVDRPELSMPKPTHKAPSTALAKSLRRKP